MLSSTPYLKMTGRFDILKSLDVSATAIVIARDVLVCNLKGFVDWYT